MVRMLRARGDSSTGQQPEALDDARPAGGNASAPRDRGWGKTGRRHRSMVLLPRMLPQKPQGEKLGG